MQRFRQDATILFAAAIFLSATTGWSQRNGSGSNNGTQTQTNQSPTPTLNATPSNGGGLDANETMHDRMVHMEEEQAKMRNNERQKKMVSDTEKLLKLANELKADVEKTDKNTLSVDVIRKAEEIEKLAKAVKERMRE